MRFRWFAVATLALFVVGCKSKLGDELSAGQAGMDEGATQAVKELGELRAKSVAEAFATRDTLPGDEPPLRKFWLEVVKDDLAGRAEASAKTYAASAEGATLASAAEFLRLQKEYWTTEVKPGKLNRYMDELGAWLEKAKAAKHPLLEHARFELEFLHVDHFVRAQKLPEDTRLTSFFRFWKFAFDFMPEKRESFNGYIDRLCKAKLGEFCKTLMWEHRPLAIRVPYEKKLIERLEALRADYPQTAYGPVLDEMIAIYQKDLEIINHFEEYPVLPEARTAADAVGGYELVYGPRGVLWNGDPLVELAKGERTISAAELPGALEQLGNRLDAALRAVGEDPEVEIDRVVAQVDKDVPLAAILPFLDSFLAHKVAEFGFMARRRADGTNRKVGTYFGVYYTPPPLDAEAEKAKSADQRKMESEGRLKHDPRRKMPVEIAGLACVPFGRTGKVLAETEQPTSYVAFGKDTVSFGPVVAPASYVEGTATAGPAESTLATKDVLAAPQLLDEWVKAHPGPVVLAVQGSLTYEEFIRVLHRVIIGCPDEACTTPTPLERQTSLVLCR